MRFTSANRETSARFRDALMADVSAPDLERVIASAANWSEFKESLHG